MIGTATAGQAARTLGEGARPAPLSTLARLTVQLDRGELRLGERSVVILDESGMTDDLDLARLLAHVGTSGAKLVMVGDHRQLGAVGPGGALAALVARHPDATHRLMENRRQGSYAPERAMPSKAPVPQIRPVGGTENLVPRPRLRTFASIEFRLSPAAGMTFSAARSPAPPASCARYPAKPSDDLAP